MFYITFSCRPNFLNCSVEEINCVNLYPALFYSSLASYVSNLNLSGSTLKNINHNGSSSSFGLCIRVPGLRLTATNITFANITGMVGNGFRGGVVYIDNSAGITFNLTQCTFTQIKNAGDGGVIYTNINTNFTITACVFELCSSNGVGGAIYINNTGIFTFLNSKFLNNSGNSGGNDIYHSTNLASLYTSNNFVKTCSLSDSPRISFLGNVNLDNLLLGMYFDDVCF
jgi:hypothetical protein